MHIEKTCDFRIVGGVWPDSKFGRCFIFPKENENYMDNYALGIYYKILEGLTEAAPQLTIQTISILQNLNPSKCVLRHYNYYRMINCNSFLYSYFQLYSKWLPW